MDIRKLYEELLEELEKGHGTAIVSTYKADTSIEKRLLSSNDPAQWHELKELLAHPQAEIAGPVASILASDGNLTIIERYNAKPRLIILGAGHIAVALIEMAHLVDFQTVVFDDRPSFANPERFPFADEVICDGFDRVFERIAIRPSDYLVIVTRGHRHDSECLEGILSGIEPIYTGMIGSKRRVSIVMDSMREKGFDDDRLAKIHSPIGLRINAVTPAEIAVAIIGELISIKRSEQDTADLISCDLEVIEAIAHRKASADALITVFQTAGSVPIGTGAKLSMTYEGDIRGTIGGGCSESDAMQVARKVIKKGGWRNYLIDMRDSAEDDGMVCGGEMRVVIEPL